MKCPFCEHNGSRVIDSRPAELNTMIRRRRECERCKKRFTTFERIESIPLIVVKKDGKREAYDRNKMANGILKACEKRPVSAKMIEDLVNRIERELYQNESKEVSSAFIGERIMEELRSWRNFEKPIRLRMCVSHRFIDNLKMSNPLWMNSRS